MLINIFLFFQSKTIGFGVVPVKGRQNRNCASRILKMSVVQACGVVLPAFQTTILRTFFELTKFF